MRSVCTDHCHFLREAPEEVVVSGLHGRRRCAMGAVVRNSDRTLVKFTYQLDRIVNAELRQPKSEQGRSSLSE